MPDTARALTTSAVPSATTRPRLMITMRSQVLSASLRMWVEKMTVFSRPASLMMARISTIWLGSRPEVGSSRIRMSGIAEHGVGQADALLVTARQLAEGAVDHVAEPAQLGHGADPLAAVLRLDAAHGADVLQVVVHHHVRVQGGELRQVGRSAASPPAGCPPRPSPAPAPSPRWASGSRWTMRMVVVLPAPLGPSRPRISPLLTVKLTPSSARVTP